MANLSILIKIKLHALQAEMQNADFVEIWFTSQMDFTVICIW
jgi:hypothetical protein